MAAESSNSQPYGYTHQGMIGKNGCVDPEKTTEDPNLLSPTSSDELYHVPPVIGNSEIWYVDVADQANAATFIVQLYFQTEASKRDTGLYATIFTQTQEYGVYNQRACYPISDLQVASDRYDIRIATNRLHTRYDEKHQTKIYCLKIQIEDIDLDLELIPLMEGWKPFGNMVHFERNKRQGTFSVVSLVPKASVSGSAVIGNIRYEINQAFGYHDHTVWETAVLPETGQRRLYADDTITRWEFGKFVNQDYLIIFNLLWFRPWLRQKPVRTLMVAKGGKIIHSSNNLVAVEYRQHRRDSRTGNRYPAEIHINPPKDSGILKCRFYPGIFLKKEDLLPHVPSLVKPIVRSLFGRPAAYYLSAEVDAELLTEGGTKEKISGEGLYELFILNEKPTRFEDWLRKYLNP